MWSDMEREKGSAHVVRSRKGEVRCDGGKNKSRKKFFKNKKGRDEIGNGSRYAVKGRGDMTLAAAATRSWRGFTFLRPWMYLSRHVERVRAHRAAHKIAHHLLDFFFFYFFFLISTK